MEFRDLKKQYKNLKIEIDREIAEVIEHTSFISGDKVKQLEKELADYVGVKHCISCANGTDALSLALMAWNIGKGDAVFVPDFTFFSTGECPAAEGAVPIFVDVDARTYNLSPEKLEAAVKNVLEEGKYTPKAVIAVDLFGQPAEYDKIQKICKQYNLLLLEDGAQGFGGSVDGRMACSFGDISTTSFFPAKPLGCYGDGGAVFTDNDEWAAIIRSLAVHGKSGEDKYNNIYIGRNSRLDTIQAAVLLVKLKAFRENEMDAVNRVAAWYNRELKNSGLLLPEVKDGFVSSWAQYTVQLPKKVNRGQLQERLRALKIPTMVYYAKPMHRQGAFAGTDSARSECPVTEQLCKTVLSLPMHPYMDEEQAAFIAGNLRKCCG
ncbi:MAG: DegT/DnrJ/EryC1/StrS family aminotransferase [Bacteroidales bacterium]|nr:DegT/DnrJ/EryC1/StrS family aminotransferase [Clostridium sp.]MCM1202918.1 DegT/DnrJ/EryC1/StrS family aminotransferase [Bacteroidales bacterium]